TGLVLVATAAGKLTQHGLGRLLAAPGAATLLHLATQAPEHLLRILIKPICATLSHLGDHLAATTLASVTLTALTTTPPTTALGFLPALRAYNLYPTLPAIRARTFIVSGDVDPLTPPAHSRDLAAAIPGARHISVPGAGHMLPQQAPAVIHRAICQALAPALAGGNGWAHPAKAHQPLSRWRSDISAAPTRHAAAGWSDPIRKEIAAMPTHLESEQASSADCPATDEPCQPGRNVPIGSFTADPAANARHSAFADPRTTPTPGLGPGHADHLTRPRRVGHRNCLRDTENRRRSTALNGGPQYRT
ncbi:MAG: alpha/beta fold hydrolase, partial [Mycobacterium sp.]